MTSLNRSRRKINCYPEESCEEKYQSDGFFAFKFFWSEIRGWILDQASVATLQSNTLCLWRCKQHLLQLALMNQQLFVDAGKAIRLPVTQLHLSNLVHFTQADLTNSQLKWHFHLKLRGWEKAFEGLCFSDELGRGTKPNKVFLWQELGRDWDSWLLHYSKHVGGLSHVLRSGKELWLEWHLWGEWSQSFAEGGSGQLCHMQHTLTASLSSQLLWSCSLCFRQDQIQVVRWPWVRATWNVCNFLHLFDCGIYSSFLPLLSFQWNSYQRTSLLVLIPLWRRGWM